MIYLLSILFTVCFVYYSKWQFQDFATNKNVGKWHPYGMIMRLLMFLTPLIMQYFPADWKDYLLAGTINATLWELLINKIALNKSWLYVGTTANTDKFFGVYKWHLCVIAIVVAVLIRLY